MLLRLMNGFSAYLWRIRFNFFPDVRHWVGETGQSMYRKVLSNLSDMGTEL
jgi:hypothetical protein